MSVNSLLSELAQSVPLQASVETSMLEVPLEKFAALATQCSRERKLPLALMFATDERAEHQAFAVHAVFAVDAEQTFITLRALVPEAQPHFPSLTPTIMAAHWYERLIQDQFGLIADGHPDGRRLLHHESTPANTFPLRKDFAWNTKLRVAHEAFPMTAVEGRGVYEIPVGPIHAGIIEPGHFRFNVRGERILSLEGKLFFKHKGVEKIVEGKTPLEALPFIERVSCDMTVGHVLAFAQAIESAVDCQVPERAKYLRVIWNELERITMHIFDIGNIGGNGTGFTFMAAQGFRLVERLRRLNEVLTGHRFLRGAVVPGGVAFDLKKNQLENLLEELSSIENEMREITDVALGSDGLLERFETTGVLKQEAAVAYGALGVAARASGIARDDRRDRPYAAYGKLNVQVVTQTSGDVWARFQQRLQELTESFRLIRECVAHLPKGAVAVACEATAGSALGWAEAWRGEILDWVSLDESGRITRCVIRDPSFCNWPLFGEIGPGNIVPDFPLCNKSLNLSYTGTDL